MKLNPQDLEKITDLTLDHYNERAEDIWKSTRDHNVNQNIAALLQCIEGKPPFTIGDYIDRGPSSLGVLRFYCSLEKGSILYLLLIASVNP
jgi:hypothetical protein